MKAKLIVEGKEFPIEIQDPELQKLLTPQKKTGYERVDGSEKYWCQVSSGNAIYIYNRHDANDIACYNTANYYSDEIVAKNNTRADKLMRQLRRFAVEHREQEIDWNSKVQNKFSILYDYSDNEIAVERDIYGRYHGIVYFDSIETARLAIETFHDELIWYFTEYKDSL